MPEPERRECWCGNKTLQPYSPDYGLCGVCGTLVSQGGLNDEGYKVQDDETDFYGKQYWLDHQAAELGLPQIVQRTRLDLAGRCLHWLRHLMSYRRPPARILELGASHGGFVALLRWAGYDATGLEMSPWVADLARRTFDVPMLVGPVEQQGLAPASFDVIVANDVMEHLPDPVTTLKVTIDLLKPDGVLIIQMPDFPEDQSHEQLVLGKNRFLLHTREPVEHLYLYSKRAASTLLARLGLKHVDFHTPVFDYDMYFAASRGPQERCAEATINAVLETEPARRLVLALIDKAAELDQVTGLWRVADADRNARLNVIDHLNRQLLVSDADRAARLDIINHLNRQLLESDADRAARLNVIEVLNRQLQESEADRAARLGVIDHLNRQLLESEADRAARLNLINQLTEQQSEGKEHLLAMKMRMQECEAQLLVCGAQLQLCGTQLQNCETRQAAQHDVIVRMNAEIDRMNDTILRRIRHLPARVLRFLHRKAS